ncbi:hypothetical protein AAHE18_05G019800 [Arachis hypogaea]
MCCDRLNNLTEGMRHLMHLERLEIWACPELVALPSSMNQLTSLLDVTIFEWLGHMTSLQQLHIGLCPELRSLPSGFRHLTNLQKLYINECPKLAKQCKREAGEDWQNIAHIPHFELVAVQEETFCEKISTKWNPRKSTRDQSYYLTPDYEFDRMVDQL